MNPFVLGVVGWSGSGKTTLLVPVIRWLTDAGWRVSTVKHAHHSVDLDPPGKDSRRHRDAGAQEVMLAAGARWFLMREHRDAPEPSLDALLARMAPADLVLVEGFKAHPYDKLEVWRAATGKAPLWPQDPSIVAVASDGPVDGFSGPVLNLNDPPAVAAFILQHAKLL